jgi:P4 family phage/plasmid primase-like protien
MYGSNKPGRTPYLATHAVKLVISGGACVSCVSDAALNPRDWRSWVPQLSVQTSTPEQAWSLGDATEGEVDALEQAWAERRFADLQDNGVMEPPNRDPETESLWGKDGDAAKARGLVKCLNAKRADTYHTWRDVGFALYATSPELADAWHEFSAKSGKYDRRVCQMFWDRLGQTHHGGPRLKFGSLVMWAKEDSPTQLDDLKNDTLDKILHSAIKGHSHTDWGEYVREAMLNTLASVRASGSGRDRNLYTFSEHRWHYEPDGASVKNFLKKAAVDHVQSQLDQFPDDEELKKNGAKAIGLLKNKGFRDSVVGDITESVADNSFQDKLDTQRHLIGWKNGVFDLVTQKFRDGRPEDYITLSTGHVYLEPGTQRYIDASVEFDAFFAKVHTNLALRKYCLDSLAVMLSGTIFFEHMHCWTGCGSNGKSKFMKLLDEGLGDYMKTLPPSLITGARPESGKATPELCSAAGARIVILPEMDGKATINVAIMKELTGGDKIAVRALYGAATVIRPQFTMIMTCNDLSKVDSNDEGTWRRLKVLPYKSTFVLNQEDCLTPQTFVAENDLDARFKDWAPYVVSMLQARYPSALLAMRTEPAEITAEVKTYRLASDRDADFVAQNLVKKTEEDGDAWEDADAWALLDIYKREGRDRGVTLGKLSEKLHRFDIPKAVLDDATGTATIPGYRLAMRGRG